MGRGEPHLQGGVQVFHGMVHEGALLPTLICSLQRYSRYYPNITIIWDGRICMFAVLLRFTLSYKVSAFYHVCMTGQLL
jgi:hypothetical protein